jgi:hypothetical protein
MIYDRLNKRLPRPSSIKKVKRDSERRHQNEEGEVRMGSAKYKKRRDEPSFIIPD